MPARPRRAGSAPGAVRTTAMNSRHAEPATPRRPLLRSALSALLSVAALWLLTAFPTTRLFDQLTTAPAASNQPARPQAGTPHS